MTAASARIAATPSAATAAIPQRVDRRRISEHDADYRRLHTRVERVLRKGIRDYVRALRTEPVSEHGRAASTFIAHQTQALQLGYLAGHWEGERDYWHSASQHHGVRAHVRLSQAHGVAPDVSRMRRALMFYGAASIAKMAREGQAAWQADQRTAAVKLFEGTGKLDARDAADAGAVTLDAKANTAMDAWLGGLSARVALSADVTWTGLQDGYLAAGTVDPANPWAYVWWQLDPGPVQHCDDCPVAAAGSPYTAPGSGGNELWQTPGDGSTACGAACKCSLQYGSSQEPGAASDYAPPAPVVEPAAPTPNSVTAQQAAAWEQWLASLPKAAGGGVALPQPLPATPPDALDPNSVTAQQRAAWKQWLEQLPKAPQGAAPPLGAEGAQIVDTMATPSGMTRDFVHVTSDGNLPEPLATLTPGQKQALDDIRGVALLWDAIRGPFPSFQQYFDPDSAVNLWQNRTLAGMDSAQREVVERYFKALGDWADNTPMG